MLTEKCHGTRGLVERASGNDGLFISSRSYTMDNATLASTVKAWEPSLFQRESVSCPNASANQRPRSNISWHAPRWDNERDKPPTSCSANVFQQHTEHPRTPTPECHMQTVRDTCHESDSEVCQWQRSHEVISHSEQISVPPEYGMDGGSGIGCNAGCGESWGSVSTEADITKRSDSCLHTAHLSLLVNLAGFPERCPVTCCPSLAKRPRTGPRNAASRNTSRCTPLGFYRATSPTSG